ncbi:hypothetical protein [Jeotgalibacillus salarius]|uniref:Uncharacterized protein n=1 Tax=Jeotgalibacillus salarius TaxID=546023 RepID=A0A4Y8LBL4_9BACL|nr:hypothetical protein [Jeotgalibacillus salarius]TFD99773.1 hypothetical protein E2626_13405 [Jeotgalibacillus salarius]
MFLLLTAVITGLVLLIGAAPAAFSTPLAITAAVLFAASVVMAFFQLFVAPQINIYTIVGMLFSVVNIASLFSFLMLMMAEPI